VGISVIGLLEGEVSMDFKVKLIKYNSKERYFTLGKTYEVKDGIIFSDEDYKYDMWAKKYGCNIEGLNKWLKPWYEFELVEEKKVFTKADLKNGDVIKRRNGWVEIVCLETGTLIARSGFNEIKDIKDDLTDDVGTEYDIVAVRRPKRPCECQFCAFNEEYGDLVYDRERDTVREITVAEIEKALGYTVKIVK
jgi:hypothetical protein